MRFLKGRLPLILAGVFMLHMMATTAFWRETVRSLSYDQLSYSERRAQYGFQGLTFDGIRLRLNEVLAPDTRVALAPQILNGEFFVQRLTESMYPRLVDHTARNILEIAPITPENTTAITLVQQMGQHGLFLRGPIVHNTNEPQPGPDWNWSVIQLAVNILAALGLGAALWIFLSNYCNLGVLPSQALPGTLLLLGALAITILTNFLTYVQLSAPPGLSTGLGILAALALSGAMAAKKIKLPKPHIDFPRWESGVGVLALVIIFTRIADFPITEWDGRSIWFFNAKRIFTHGMFLKSDITHFDSLWSHPDYPLLYPAWISHFSSLNAAFSERMASLGIPVLLTGSLSLLWYLARHRVGRWVGAALVAGAYLAVDHATAGGYVDGFLMIFLLIEFLAFSFSELEAVAWIAAAAASLIKAEGIILAGTIAIVFTLFRSRRSLWPYLVFGPALFHKIWIGTLGIDSLFKGKTLGAIVSDFIPRLGTALAESPTLLSQQGYTQLRALLWDGLCGLLLTLALCLTQRKIPQLLKIALAIAAVQILFAFGSISLMPEDVRWFVGSALDRLLLHPAALLTLSPFLLLAASKGAHGKVT